MKILQTTLRLPDQWSEVVGDLDPARAQVVLVFGLRRQLADPSVHNIVQARFPNASIVFSSTAGSFLGTRLFDEELTLTAIQMEHSTVRLVSERFQPEEGVEVLCENIVDCLHAPDFRHVLVFSDGSIVNGSRLTEAFNSKLPPGVTVSGGLAGDGTDFTCTLTGLNAPPSPGLVVAIGFYGKSLETRFGSVGGWSAFGPERMVTRSVENRLEELDGRCALDIYRKYLGPEADELPAAALRFPLLVKMPGTTNPVVRTILMIDEEVGTMTFAGDIPEGSTVRFMRASYEDLLTGAEAAAQAARLSADLVLCVSCVGRRIVLGQRTEDELEAVRHALGNEADIAGFYSYGELAPSGTGGRCQLHNQTMTVTSFREAG